MPANVDAVSLPFSSRSRALVEFNVLLALDGQGFCETFRDMKAENPNPFFWGWQEAELPFPVG